MDSNGTQFVLLNSAEDFRTEQQDCGWNTALNAFTLTRQDQPRLPQLDATRFMSLWSEALPYVLDDHGQIGRLAADRRQFEWSLSWPGTDWQTVRASLDPDSAPAIDAAALTLDPVNAPVGTVFTDLHLGGSGLVALPYSNNTDQHGFLLTHLRKRWQIHCNLDFAPLRAWVDDHDRIWIAGTN